MTSPTTSPWLDRGALGTLLLVLILAGCQGVPIGSEADANTRGLAALDDGRIEEAHRLFQESVEAQPDMALGWLNLARTTYLLNKGTPPEDECVKEDNWNFTVLSLLSRAVELDSDAVLERLSAGTKEFTFKDTDLYEKWRLAVTPRWTEDAIQALMQEREWWPTVNSFPEKWISFEADGNIVTETFESSEVIGNWKAADGFVEVRFPGDRVVKLRPEKAKSYFQQGEAWHFTLGLSPEPADAELPWSMPVTIGPRVGDCGDYNF